MWKTLDGARLLLVWLLLASTGMPAFGATGKFVDRVFGDTDGNHKYVVFEPAGYAEDAEKTWPVILFLHGAGERGDDGRAQTGIGLGPVVKKRADTFPFLVIFPQCEETRGPILKSWLADSKDGKRALAILEDVAAKYRVDRDRQVLSGWSMGGYGVWDIARAHPTRFSAVVPLSGGGNPAWAPQLKNVPIWAFHGAKDPVVRVEETRKIVESLRAVDADTRYTELPQGDHDIWSTAFDSPQLIEWMLGPKTFETGQVAFRARPGERPPVEAAEDAPFVPAVEIPDAISVRLGNRMLNTLAVSIPQLVPAELLRGRVDDIHDSTVAEGRSFRVVLSGISYSGEIARAKIEAYRADRLNIQLGLKNLQMRIGGASLSGRSHSASAGPMSVVIGHRRPVWLSIDVTPYVQDRQLKLKLVATRFEIPGDNWYATAPAGVSARGLGMTREKVSNGLVNGVYGRKARIESEIRAMVPAMIPELERKLEVSEMTKLVSSFWPLPVYRPRLRAWPQAVATDKGGVSLVLGVTAAAVDANRAPKEPRRIAGVGTKLNEIPKSTNLWVGVAPGMLTPLTQLLIDADVARVHVSDIPEKKFARLVERNSLIAAIPDLRNYDEHVEIWSELVLSNPLGIGASAGDGNRLQIAAPKLHVSLAIRPNRAHPKWQPYVELDLTVVQKTEVGFRQPTRATRALQLNWVGEADVRIAARFASGYAPQDKTIDAQQLRALFADAWQAWTLGGPAAEIAVEDIDFGISRLRLSDAGWSAPNLYTEFGIPGVLLTNSTQRPLVYETKGPYSGWGGPYSLAPGETDEFEIGYPLTYRSSTSGISQTFTLPPGSHSEFRKPREGGPPALFQARELIPPFAKEAAGEEVTGAKSEKTTTQ
ncbi:MAG: hypothetical protein CMJ48_14660 [Planctomycetaceae bacterium]|nr:hypothetical protein [Planctomycetaceae bacterium]